MIIYSEVMDAQLLIPKSLQPISIIVYDINIIQIFTNAFELKRARDEDDYIYYFY